MINNKEVAKQTILIIKECSDRLDESITLVQDSCDPNEFQKYRKVAGRIMGSMLIDIMNPIFKEHPDIMPKELKDVKDAHKEKANKGHS